MTITLRSATQTGATTKGSALTHAELDGNFQAFMASDGSSNVGFIQSGTGAFARTAQDKMRDLENLKDRGGAVDGATDDSTAIQNSVNRGGTVSIPPGTCMMAAQVVIANACHLIIEATIKPKVNAGVTGTPLFLITASNVTVEFRDAGGIDGISSTYSNWNGVAALSSTLTLENVNVIGGSFQNIGLQNTSMQVINFTYVKNGAIIRPKIKNCGVTLTQAWAAGVAGIYTAYCENVNVIEPEGDTVGTTWINSSANLNCQFVRPVVRNAPLFGYKGGYGSNNSLSADVTPSTTTFSVAKTSTTSRQFRAGQAFMMPRSSNDCPKGVMQTVTDNGTYLTIVTVSAMAAAPIVATDVVQLVDTNTRWIEPRLWFCGDNGFDVNGCYGLVIDRPVIDYAGMYLAAGTYSGLRAGIWIGYDPQGGLNQLDNDEVYIRKPIIRHPAGNGISVQVSNSVRIEEPYVSDYNAAALATADYGNGIDVNNFVLHRQSNVEILNPVVRGGNAAGGKAIKVNFTDGVRIVAPTVSAVDGIQINECLNVRMADDDITVTGTGAIALLLSNQSGNFPLDNVLIGEGRTNVSSSSGNNFNCTDASATNLFINPSRIHLGSATVPNASLATLSMTGQVAYGGQDGLVDDVCIKNAVANAAAITIGKFVSASNTGGGLIIEGTAERFASGMAAFKCVFFGHSASTGKAYTEHGHTGTAPVVAGDFTLSVSGSVITCTYTNNSGGTVGITARVTAFGSPNV